MTLIEQITTAIASMTGKKEYNVLKADNKLKELSALLKDANKQIADMSKELEEVKQQNACLPEMTQSHVSAIEAKDAELKAMAEAHAAVVADYQAKLDIKIKTEEAIESDIAKRSNLETAAKLAALGVSASTVQMPPTSTSKEDILAKFMSLSGEDKTEFFRKNEKEIKQMIYNR